MGILSRSRSALSLRWLATTFNYGQSIHSGPLDLPLYTSNMAQRYKSR